MPRRLKGKRIGVFRQRFVGFTGEREVAANMERVIKELQSAGAIVVDVAIPDYDAKYAAARGAAPGSLRDGWTAYLSRGAKPGDKVLTIQDLLASGKLAPVSARRFEGALAPAPAGRGARRGHAPVHRRPRNLPADLRRPDGSAEARRDAVSGQSRAAAHARRRPRALWIGARHLRRKRGDRACRKSPCRPASSAAAIRSAFRCWAGCGTTSGCWKSPPRTNAPRIIGVRRRRCSLRYRTLSSPRSAISFLKCATSRSRRFIIASISLLGQEIRRSPA